MRRATLARQRYEQSKQSSGDEGAQSDPRFQFPHYRFKRCSPPWNKHSYDSQLPFRPFPEGYPRRVNIVDVEYGDLGMSSLGFERTGSASGVISPSDTRRPGVVREGKDTGTTTASTSAAEERLHMGNDVASETTQTPGTTVEVEGPVNDELGNSDAQGRTEEADLDSLTAEDIRASRPWKGSPSASIWGGASEPFDKTSEARTLISDEDLNSLTADALRASTRGRMRSQESSVDITEPVDRAVKDSDSIEGATATDPENSTSGGRLESSLDRMARVSDPEWERSAFKVGNRRDTPFTRKLANLYSKGSYVDDIQENKESAAIVEKNTEEEEVCSDDAKTSQEKPSKEDGLDFRELRQEIRKAYEDVYGPITADHRQVPEKHITTSAATEKLEEGLRSSEPSEVLNVEEPEVENKERLLEREAFSKPSNEDLEIPRNKEARNKEIDASDETVSTLDQQASAPVAPDIQEQSQEETPDPIIKEAPDTSPESDQAEPSSQPPVVPEASISAGEESINPTKYTYKILCYDPSTEEMHITTTTNTSIDPPAPAIPIHEALAELISPAKFIPHLTPNPSIVTSKPNLLVLLQSVSSPSSSAHSSQILSSETHNDYESDRARDQEAKEEELQPFRINPIDGTTRLSPTGFVGVDPEIMKEGLERDVDADQRQQYYETWKVENGKREREREREWEGDRGWGWRGRERDGRERRRSHGVLKTAIVAGTACYVVGVVGELMK